MDGATEDVAVSEGGEEGREGGTEGGKEGGSHFWCSVCKRKREGRSLLMLSLDIYSSFHSSLILSFSPHPPYVLQMNLLLTRSSLLLVSQLMAWPSISLSH